jgi:hypothetical protein
MIKQSTLRFPFYYLIGLLWATMGFGLTETRAGDLKLTVQLIWGTDEEKPKEKKLKEVESKLADKLRRVFKWKNYFEVSNQNVILPTNAPQKLAMSRKCELELKRVDAEIVELKLVGEGKHVKTVRQRVKLLLQGEYSILAGDDKEKYDDAWFVVISLAAP